MPLALSSHDGHIFAANSFAHREEQFQLKGINWCVEGPMFLCLYGLGTAPHVPEIHSFAQVWC